MINRKILYFYEYASEVKGRCTGHARILVCGDMLKVSLAFSLPGWEKKPCNLYFVVEDCNGKVKAISPGDIMPCEIMTVYNIEIASARLEGIHIKDIVNLGFVLVNSNDRYIKAVTGCFELTLERLRSIISDKEERNALEENKKEDEEYGRDKVVESAWKEFEEEKSENKVCNECISIDAEIKKKEMTYRETEEDSSLPDVIRVRNYISGLMSNRPEYNPFESGKISYCVRIGVGDAINLAGYEPGLRDNSFLMHGFYRYKHLLLAGGMQKGHMNYYILVPGVKIEREQRLADMYGFHDFMSLDGQPSSRGAFGYYSWLLPS